MNALRLAIRALAGMAWLLAPPCFAAATMTCTPAGVATLSPSPSRIIVPSTASTGTALWGGTLSVSFSCTSSASGAKLTGGSLVGGSSATALVSSSSVADGVSILSAGTPSLVLSAPGCALGTTSQKAGNWTFGLSSTAAGTCSGSLVAPVQLVRNASALGADIAASNPTGGGGGASNWVVFPTKTGGGGTSSIGLSAGVPLVSGGGCTVAPVALTVTLPTISESALSTAGQSAGATAFAFPLLSCQAAPSPSYSVYASWSFSAVAGYPTVIQNSAAGAAGNVGVQILDGAGNAVSSGPSAPSVVGSVASSGAVSAQTYIARYFATGTVSPGVVTATATYTLTYQ